jgi:hypothetical protein
MANPITLSLSSTEGFNRNCPMDKLYTEWNETITAIVSAEVYQGITLDIKQSVICITYDSSI